MTPYVQPYLAFAGNCESALAYYQKHLGAEVQMAMKFSESPEPCAEGQLPENWDDKVMHCGFTIGSSALMGSDGWSAEKTEGGHCMSLTVADADEAKRVFDALADGGKVFMPLGNTFGSPCFGMVSDRFGISWMVATPEMK